MSEKYSTISSLLKKSGSLLRGHFILSRGLHSDKYIQCAQFLKSPKNVEYAARLLMLEFSEVKDKVDLVISPAVGALLLGYEVAKILDKDFMFFDKEDGVIVPCPKRGFEVKKGDRCLIIEDVVTTGGAVQQIADYIHMQQGKIMGIGCIVDRIKEKRLWPYRFKSLTKTETHLWLPEDCPQCKEAGTTLPCDKEKRVGTKKGVPF